MKSFQKGIALPIAYIIATLTIFSCSENDVQPHPTNGAIRIAETWAIGSATRVELWATEALFSGYNQITFLLYDSVTGQRVTDADLQLHPRMQMTDKAHSCPFENPKRKTTNTYEGAVLFTMPSGETGSWTLEVDVSRSTNVGKAILPVNVLPKSPSPIAMFNTPSGERVVLATLFFKQPVIGSNPFEIVAFRAHGHDWEPHKELQFTMHTEMPSMDHGSPNNVNPVHDHDGHYQGKVNFTMSGDWRIHLEIESKEESFGTRSFDVSVK